MDPARVGLLAASAVIVLLAVLTGPIGAITVPEPGFQDLGSGQANVDVLSAPEEVTLRSDVYGDAYYLEVPETTVDVSNVTGSPTMTVSVSIDALGYSRSTLYVVDDSWDGRRRVAVERASLNATRIDRSAYDGSLRIVLRDGRGTTVVHNEPITVEVVE